MDADDALRRVEAVKSTDARTFAMVSYLFGAGYASKPRRDPPSPRRAHTE